MNQLGESEKVQKVDWSQAQPLCISIPAAAKMLGVSRNTGYEMAKIGQLPVIKCGRRRLVVPKAALEKMLREGNEKHEERTE
jgi:excisionase family DNA binding protein